jgi:hypothetical protein
MRAGVMYGAGDVRVEDVPDARLHQPTDAIVRVVQACICGSVLWPYQKMPTQDHGRRATARSTTTRILPRSGSTQQLTGHVQRALDNSVTHDELKELIVHLAFYAGWPKSMSAISVAQQVLTNGASS